MQLIGNGILIISVILSTVIIVHTKKKQTEESRENFDELNSSIVLTNRLAAIFFGLIMSISFSLVLLIFLITSDVYVFNLLVMWIWLIPGGIIFYFNMRRTAQGKAPLDTT